MATFKANTFLPDSQGTLAHFAAEDEVPDWAYGQITNLDLVDGDISIPAPDPSGKPPVRGPGSSRDAWAAYASAQGVAFESDASATAIQAAVAAHEEQSGS